MKKELAVSNKMSVMVNAMLDDVGSSIKIKCHLGQFLKERGIKLEELVKLTGIRVGTLSEMVNTARPVVNFHHLIVIANVLGITDFSELYTLEIKEAKKEEMEERRKQIDDLGITEEMEMLIHDNELVRTEVNLDYDKRKKSWKEEGMKATPPLEFLELQVNNLGLDLQHPVYQKFKKKTPTN
ncbi:helix-turn-helix transcriptional regulator [Priestia megaterium]